jgi:hypothetical protein
MRLRLGERDAEGAFQEARASFYALDRLDETDVAHSIPSGSGQTTWFAH